MLPELSFSAWLMLALAAFGIGVSKSGLAGVGMIHILIFAAIFGAKDSTGVLLPLLIAGDICAIVAFGREAQWHYIRRLLPLTFAGVLAGWALMGRLDDAMVSRLIGVIILGLTALQLYRLWRPESLAHLPHTAAAAAAAALLTGFTTMIANAAGPVMALYLLSVGLTKLPLVGTMAWLFFWINLSKVPLSYQLGLIGLESVMLDLLLTPGVVAGMAAGRYIVSRIPQLLFNSLLLLFTAVAALRMLF